MITLQQNTPSYMRGLLDEMRRAIDKYLEIQNYDSGEAIPLDGVCPAQSGLQRTLAGACVAIALVDYIRAAKKVVGGGMSEAYAFFYDFHEESAQDTIEDVALVSLGSGTLGHTLVDELFSHDVLACLPDVEREQMEQLVSMGDTYTLFLSLQKVARSLTARIGDLFLCLPRREDAEAIFDAAAERYRQSECYLDDTAEWEGWIARFGERTQRQQALRLQNQYLEDLDITGFLDDVKAQLPEGDLDEPAHAAIRLLTLPDGTPDRDAVGRLLYARRLTLSHEAVDAYFRYVFIPDAELVGAPTTTHISAGTSPLTPEVTAQLTRLQQATVLDDTWQPRSGLTQAQKSMIVEYVAARADVPNKWQVFGQLWGINPGTLRAAYNKGADTQSTKDFNRMLQRLG